MSNFPLPVHDYIRTMIDTRMPAYLRVNADHRLVAWGGSLDIYGLTDLNRHQRIEAQVVFLEGLLPLDDPTFCLSWIELQSGCYADIHLFAIDDAVWVLLLNATPEASQHRQMQQRVNAAALASKPVK